MRKAIQPIALSLMIFSSHFSLQSTAFAEGGGMLEEMKKLKPGDEAAIEKLKYKYYYKSKIDKLNAMADRNRAATKKEEEAIAKANREGAAKDKAAAAKSNEPVKSGDAPKTPVASASPAANGFKKSIKSTESSSTSAPVKVDSDTPDELSFPGE